jgi:hypothetical protein
MAKSIHERVRAALESKERAERKAADTKHNRRMAALERRDVAADKRIDGILDGTIEPRTDAEWDMLIRYQEGFES